MRRAQHLDALGGGDQRHEADILGGDAIALQHIDRMGAGIAGGQHRIGQDEQAALGLGQLHQIFDRTLGVMVAIDADMADAGGGQQIEQPVGHADAGAQDRHHRQFLAGDDRGVEGGQRSLDRLIGDRQIAGDLVAHQQRDLAQQLAEGLGRGALVAHMGQLVLDQRMIDDVQIGEAGFAAHYGSVL